MLVKEDGNASKLNEWASANPTDSARLLNNNKITVSVMTGTEWLSAIALWEANSTTPPPDI